MEQEILVIKIDNNFDIEVLEKKLLQGYTVHSMTSQSVSATNYNLYTGKTLIVLNKPDAAELYRKNMK